MDGRHEFQRLRRRRMAGRDRRSFASVDMIVEKRRFLSNQF
jgi:hypothetical protein